MGSLVRQTRISLQWTRMLSTLSNDVDNTNIAALDKSLVDKIIGLFNNVIPLDRKIKQKDIQKNIIDKDLADDSNLKKMNDRYD